MTVEQISVILQDFHSEKISSSQATDAILAVDRTSSELLDQLLSRINFDGMDPNTFTIAELKRAI